MSAVDYCLSDREKPTLQMFCPGTSLKPHISQFLCLLGSETCLLLKSEIGHIWVNLGCRFVHLHVSIVS